ncbi:MAG: tetratricopeptide repeat protein [Planctomycetes bacterium]|nr:tetratricopeptide repeat protein [Planctomycetota bacterium]
MPHLASLVEKGASGNLTSIEPLISPPIWTSIATGVKPERHGITWFLCDTERPGQRVPVTSSVREAKAFWNILTENRRTVGVVGWWATYPAEQVRGFVVSDFVGYHNFGNTGRSVETDLGKTYPPPSIEKIRDVLPDPSRVRHEDVRRFLNVDREEFDAASRNTGRYAGPIQLFRTYLDTARSYASISERLTAKFSPDVLAVYFELPDAASHLFARFAPPRGTSISEEGWSRFSGAVEEVYRYQDELLGRLLRRVGAEGLAMVVSDHGFRWGERRPEEGDVVDIGAASRWHEPEGILVAAGPGIRRGYKISRASVLDVLPTLFRYLGVPLARDLDGAPLLDLFEPDWLEGHPASFVETYGKPRRGADEPGSESEEAARGFAEEHERRLAALGYLSREGASPEMREGRIQLLLKEGRLTEAEPEVRALARQRPADPGVRHALGEIYRGTGRVALARKEFEAAASLDPENAALLCSLAETLIELEDLQAAEGWLREAMRKDQGFVRARLTLGHVLNLQQRAEEARVEFEQVVALEPTHPRAHYNLGVLDERAGRTAEAIGRYRRAAELDPSDPHSRMNLGVLLTREGRSREAIELFAEAVRLGPEDPKALFNLGLSYLEGGMPRKAIEELEKSLLLDPDFPWAHLTLARAQLAAGETAAALKNLETAIRLDAKNPEPRYAMAVARASVNQTEGAAAALQEAIALGGSTVEERARVDPVLGKILTRWEPSESQPAR